MAMVKIECNCGFIGHPTVADKIWTCPNCDTVHDFTQEAERWLAEHLEDVGHVVFGGNFSRKVKGENSDGRIRHDKNQ